MSKKYWKISIYSLYREYGGCEEGGWWFDCGDRIREIKKIFLDKPTALKYARRLNRILKKRWLTKYKRRKLMDYKRYSAEVFYRGTPDYFPNHKPTYC